MTLDTGTADQCVIDPIAALQEQYNNGVTDEFIEPIIICDTNGGKRVIADNHAVIFFNYRIDRPRELTRAFVMPDFEKGISGLGFDPYTEKYEKTNIQEKEHIATFKRKVVLKNLLLHHHDPLRRKPADRCSLPAPKRQETSRPGIGRKRSPAAADDRN